MLRFALFSLISLHHSFSAVAGATAPYIPTENLLLNCGGSSKITSDGRYWVTDSFSEFSPSNIDNVSFASTASQKSLDANQVPYATARVITAELTYNFSLTPGPKFVRLHFYPATYSGRNQTQSFFSVRANDFTILKNFCAYLTVSYLHPQVSTFFKEFVINVKEDSQILLLTFTPNPNSFALINGIEIVSMPNNLYREGFEVTLVGSTSPLYIVDNQTAMENVYRLNAGGQTLSIDQDTGMFRIWSQDDPYLVGIAGLTAYLDYPINYTTSTPAYTAPEVVYDSTRNMITQDLNLRVNLTWVFPVHSGFNYLLRFHFCEIQQEVTVENERIFTIYINFQVAQLEADVLHWSGGRGIPVFEDYVVFVDDPTQGDRITQNLIVQMHPNTASNPKIYNALLNGLEIFKLNQSDGTLFGSNSDPGLIRQVTRRGSGKQWRIKVAEGISACAGGSVLLFVVVYLLKYLKEMKKERDKENHEISTINTSHGSLAPTRCSYSAIKKMTNTFSEKLGQGGFGTVYKGNLSDGRLVAVKSLAKSKENNGEDFINEVVIISKCSHVNAVTLLGFCYEKTKRAVVYSYMPNGSLDRLIDKIGRSEKEHRQWKMLYEISVGIARGLDYLHRGCNIRILHFDIKPQNILLDENFCPKISDFGLAKLCQQEKESIISMEGMRGTAGYIAPEVFSRNFGGVSHKSDVYSYGMMVLEMTGGRNAVMTRAEASQKSEAYFPDSIYDQNEQPLIDLTRIASEEEEILARKMTLVGLWCIQTRPSDRPSMSKVVDLLEGSIASVRIPPKPIMHSLPRSLKTDSASTLEISSKCDTDY